MNCETEVDWREECVVIRIPLLAYNTIPDYIPLAWRDRIKIVVDDKGVHYVWTGWTNGEGHGKIKQKGKACYTHRLIYEKVYDVKLTRFDFVDHLCCRKGCMNADHLESVTPRENTFRGPGRDNQFRKAA